MTTELKKPCKACPWRRESLKGYLGDSTPAEFLQQSEMELRMPCHIHVDYERNDWQHQARTAPQCAGRAIHFANRCKKPRDSDLLVLPADREEVFSNPQEFYDHHTHNNGKKIMLIMGAVIEQES